MDSSRAVSFCLLMTGGLISLLSCGCQHFGAGNSCTEIPQACHGQPAVVVSQPTPSPSPCEPALECGIPAPVTAPPASAPVVACCAPAPLVPAIGEYEVPPSCEPVYVPLNTYPDYSACVTECMGPELSVQNDLSNLFPALWEDTKGVVNWHNGMLIGIGLGTSLVAREAWDQDVRDYVSEHPSRWGTGTEVLGYLGDGRVQIPLIFSFYGYSMYTQDEELHEVSRMLIRAYTLAGLSTIALKGIVNTDRPSDQWMNGEYGFPSGHMSTHFALSAVLDSYYGPEVGIPLYMLGGLIGWSRMDEQDHDLSDVVFGAVLGYVIGKSIANRQITGDPRVNLGPWFHPTEGTPGIMIDYSF